MVFVFVTVKVKVNVNVKVKVDINVKVNVNEKGAGESPAPFCINLNILGFCCRQHVVWYCIVDTVRILDGTEVLLVFADVVVQSHKQTLGMERCHDGTLAHYGTLDTGHGLCKVNDELSGGVSDDGKVAVDTHSHVAADVKVKILRFFIVLWHILLDPHTSMWGYRLGRLFETC